MKRKIFAMIIPSLLAGVTNACQIYHDDEKTIDFYGDIGSRHFFSKNKNLLEDGDSTRTTLGIRGDANITDDINAFAQFEWKYRSNKIDKTNFNDATEKKRNLAYLGLKFSNYGSLDYGRNYGVPYDIQEWGDVVPLSHTNYTYQLNDYIVGENRNLFTYRSNNCFGLINGVDISLQYQGKNIEDNKSINPNSSKNDGDGFGISIRYKICPDISIGTSFNKLNQKNNIVYSKSGNSRDIISGGNATAWNIGIKYENNNIYLAGIYARSNNMNDKQMNTSDFANNQNLIRIAKTNENIELVGQYMFDEFGIRPSISYVQTKGINLIDLDYSKEQILEKHISFGAFYYFNDHLTAAINYKINLINRNEFTQKYDISTCNVIGLNLEYRF